MKKIKSALILGITGQTGSYLAKLLLTKGYIVYGTRRRTSTFPLDTNKLEQIISFKKHLNKDLFLKYGDITDISAIRDLVYEIKPDEIYNLAAQSFVKVSFDMPYYTTDANSQGLINILEIIKNYKNIDNKKIKFYQASTSEMFGNTIGTKKINESTPMIPVSPYGVSKLFSYHMVKIYREAYNLFLTNGILFNHESPLRTEHFVTKKITKGISNIFYGNQNKIYLGNLNARRDWGHAEDYANAIHQILKLKKPVDIIVAQGKSHSIRDFIKECFNYLNISVKFTGKGLNEKVIDENGKVWIEVKKEYFRPLEIDNLIGDNSNFFKHVKKFKFKHSFKSMVKDMMEYDLKKASKSVNEK